MFVLVLEHPQHRVQRRAFDKDEVTLGRSQVNDVQLKEGNISRRHARITRVNGGFFVEDLGSGNGTRINDGEPITDVTPLAMVDRVHIGDYRIRVEPALLGDEVTVERPQPDLEPTEAELVEMLDTDDDARLVYADWLEGHGMNAQAEYLRLEEQLTAAPVNDPRRPQWTARLRAIAPKTPLSWRRKLARRPVEPCSPAHWPDCPREWPRLRSTGGEDVRFCGTCDRDVFYCMSIEEAREHTKSDQRVVLDASVERSPYDIFPPPTANTPGSRR